VGEARGDETAAMTPAATHTETETDRQTHTYTRSTTAVPAASLLRHYRPNVSG